MINKIKRALLNYRKRNDTEISYEEFKIIAKNEKNFYIIDVRSKQEFEESHLPNAINIPVYNIESVIENYVRDKNTIILLYCQYGSRSKKAARKLQQKGYINVYNLKGGLNFL